MKAITQNYHRQMLEMETLIEDINQEIQEQKKTIFVNCTVVSEW